MSVDVKLFVTCGKDKTVAVGQAVKKALDVYVRDKLDEYWENNTTAINRADFMWSEAYKSESTNFTNGVGSVKTYDFNTFLFNFGIGDIGNRVLHMYTCCSCDYQDTYEGDKIIFSVGHWGSCHEIMMVVAEAVKEFGDVYYDHNDCDDEEFVKLFQE